VSHGPQRLFRFAQPQDLPQSKLPSANLLIKQFESSRAPTPAATPKLPTTSPLSPRTSGTSAAQPATTPFTFTVTGANKPTGATTVASPPSSQHHRAPSGQLTGASSTPAASSTSTGASSSAAHPPAPNQHAQDDEAGTLAITHSVVLAHHQLTHMPNPDDVNDLAGAELGTFHAAPLPQSGHFLPLVLIKEACPFLLFRSST